MATKKFDPDDFAAFLALLPARSSGRAIRHAVEVRHASFRAPDFVALAREHGVAVIFADDADFPPDRRRDGPLRLRADHGDPRTAAGGLCACRARRLGGPRPALGRTEARRTSSSGWPKPAPAEARDVFLYVISGAKHRNPAAAMALIERVG